MLRMLAILLCIIVCSHAADVDDPNSLAGSFNTYMKIREKLPLAIRNQLWITDDAEEAILGHCAKQANVPQSLFTAYTAARQAEREIVKSEGREAGTQKTVEIMDVYRAIRKETPWNFMKLRQKFKACFDKSSSGLKEYLALRKQETAKDEEINKFKTELATPPMTEQGEAPLPPKPGEAEQAQQGAESEANVDEMGRRARSEDVVTVETGKGGDRDSVINDVFGTVDDEKGTVEVYVSPDDVTSADDTNTETTTTNTNVSDNSILLKFAMVFGMIIHLVIASLILVSQGDRIAEWCRGSQNKEDLLSRRETEPLHTGKQIPANGTTFNPA